MERRNYLSRNEAGADVFDYIEGFYNPSRRRSVVGYVSPVEFEQKAVAVAIRSVREAGAANSKPLLRSAGRAARGQRRVGHRTGSPIHAIGATTHVASKRNLTDEGALVVVG